MLTRIYGPGTNSSFSSGGHKRNYHNSVRVVATGFTESSLEKDVRGLKKKSDQRTRDEGKP